MVRKWNVQAGMSLVETTIILLVLMLLTGVLAPSINDFVNDAKDVKVKEDCEAIGVSVMRLARDVGPCIKFQGDQECNENNRVEILFSNGPDVTNDDVLSSDFNNQNLNNQSLNWDDDHQGDALEDQLVGNAPDYSSPGEVLYHYPHKGSDVSGPHFFLGWRGAYLSSEIGPDPWGRRYLVNSAFLSSARDSNDPGEGHRTEGWRRDVFCISGGRDTLFSTNIGGNNEGGVYRGGDDFIYVLSGDTR